MSQISVNSVYRGLLGLVAVQQPSHFACQRAAAVGVRGEKSTNFVGAGYPLDGFQHKISDAQYELESPSKQEKAIIREMRARYTSGAETDRSARL